MASTEGWRLDTRGGQLAGVFHGNVAYFDYEGIVTEDDEGERMAEALGGMSTLIMANHGALVAAASIEVAMLHCCRSSAPAYGVDGAVRRRGFASSRRSRRAVARPRRTFRRRGYLDG